MVRHLCRAKSITAVEAQSVHRIRSLTRRITTLRDKGFQIESKWKRDVVGQRYVRYYLRSTPEWMNQPINKLEMAA